MRPRNLVVAIAAPVLLLVGAGAYIASAPAGVASAYVAKTLCSEIFLAGRDEADVRAREFEGISPALGLVHAQVDGSAGEVSADLIGLGRARALYREGYGCTLARGDVAPLPPIHAAPRRAAPLPQAEDLARVDEAAIARALDAAMTDEGAAHRSFVVIVDGAIVAERYAEGFDAKTPFLSWSMAKSVTATLVGAAVLKGALDIDAPAPVPEWRGDAERAAITWNDLLRMQSGLAFDEDYADPVSDVNRMLFLSHETGAAAAAKALAHPPGTHWYYSSGTTNLIARTLMQTLAATGEEPHAFPRRALFDPLGATSAVMEVDAAGGFVGSSYIYMTARDWARLGLLYLNDGVWDGERLLPEGWADYVAAPTPASNGAYGAQFWLNRDGEGRTRYIPEAPEDMYLMSGHEGQYVFIIPDRNAVIVRTGMTRGRVAFAAVAPTVAAIVAAIDPVEPNAAN